MTKDKPIFSIQANQTIKKLISDLNVGESLVSIKGDIKGGLYLSLYEKGGSENYEQSIAITDDELKEVYRILFYRYRPIELLDLFAEIVSMVETGTIPIGALGLSIKSYDFIVKYFDSNE